MEELPKLRHELEECRATSADQRARRLASALGGPSLRWQEPSERPWRAANSTAAEGDARVYATSTVVEAPRDASEASGSLHADQLEAPPRAKRFHYAIGTKLAVGLCIAVALAIAAQCCFRCLQAETLTWQVNDLERERDEWRSVATKLRGELREDLSGTIPVQDHEVELKHEFDFAVWDEKAERETFRCIKICCPGVRHGDVRVELIFNGCVVMIERAASPGVKEVTWEQRFQFSPSAGLFELWEDRTALEHGFLQLVFVAAVQRKREFRFPLNFDMSYADSDASWTLEQESGQCISPARSSGSIDSTGMAAASAEGLPAPPPALQAQSV